MYRVSLYFYSALNNYLSFDKRNKEFEITYKSRRSVKDLIESVGVPHTEVDVILVNDKSVDFSYILKDGDRVSVYPLGEPIDMNNIKHLKTPFLKFKFVVDVHLGKLAKYLRLLGLDTIYEKNLKQDELIRKALEEERILITRNRNLLKKKNISYAILINSTCPEKQVEELFDRYDLSKHCKPFSRCMDCNTALEPIAKDEVLDRIPPKVKERCQDFVICWNCDKIFWKGTHFENMSEFIKSYLKK